MNKQSISTIGAVLFGLCSASQSATILSMTNSNIFDLDQDGLGDFVNGSGSFVGRYDALGGATTEWSFHQAYAFQMTGASNGSDITDVAFTSDMFASSIGAGDAPQFTNVELVALGTNTTVTFDGSQFHATGTMIMSNFGDGVNGAKSLDASAESTMLTYLQNNWSEDDYVYFILRKNGSTSYADPTYVDPGNGSGTNGYNFINVALEVTAVPEPSSTALLGLAGVAFLVRRKR
ncbi:PEP-CTERM sorting domain-containing protein [Rubritalea marina]|uniref:PEP-CTERM sorting domain-containing protein n=1 Tax=Rubritalea marina TaxID=361055 RepID=UPI0009FD2013|nr:PEP-CTERM sorting domain-containing protein [Rubritalea marina]